ncbi:type II toxin-antitoxin system VapC family toxin [Oscillatoria sp. CS-180]|uniref:type II toxin-antitoxin system VapC family toxin n=1 Tax=Oscillatoria sp. CS-180 TaxID=3021720 RepID=UPI00232E84A4|nr:type II toxin-antitoxin system VapC family toxin [Oscillatoria sp. CS-180]MDB9528172.1 type II toxin-antitoxin system VapC family toxin [Oscillatoria sp. CS-180]
MSGSYLLDTNIIIGLFAGQTSVINPLQRSDEIFISSIALGELYYGARKSGRVQQNLERIEALVADVTIVGCDAATARQYGDIKNLLRAQGRPLPENDIWIAALALQYDLILVTRDAHFQHVEGLQTVRW